MIPQLELVALASTTDRIPGFVLTMRTPREVLGLKWDDAEALAGRYGCRIRIIRLDGEVQDHTGEFKSWRINVNVEHGVVVAVLGVY